MLKRTGLMPMTNISSNTVKGGLGDFFGWIPFPKTSYSLKTICRSRQNPPGGTVLVGGLGTTPEKLFHPISDSDTSCPGWNQMLPRQLRKKKMKKNPSFKSKLLLFQWELIKELSLEKDWGFCAVKATRLPNTTSKSIPNAKAPSGWIYWLWAAGSEDGHHMGDNTEAARLGQSEI